MMITPLFITLRFLDVIDIFITAFLLYQLYKLLKGTIAINILIGVFFVYIIWLTVRFLHMQLLGSILGQFMSVGVIVIIIVFQQELRRFFLVIGSRYMKSSTKISINSFFADKHTDHYQKQVIDTAHIVGETLVNMAKSKTGALIAFTRKSELESIVNSGVIINANISKSLIKSIFFKNSPLHDGAMIIKDNKILAARCLLPLTNRIDLPGHYGLRHRSAIGLTENTDAFIFIVSEETGNISFSVDGEIREVKNKDDIVNLIIENLK